MAHVIARFLFMAGGALAGLFLLVVLAVLPEPWGALCACAIAVGAGLAAGDALSDHARDRDWQAYRESERWTAQRCWEILGDDRHPLALQEQAASRLARLGRGVVATTERNWWPWRSARGDFKRSYAQSLLPESWWP